MLFGRRFGLFEPGLASRLHTKLQPAAKDVACKPLADGELQLAMGRPRHRQDDGIFAVGPNEHHLFPPRRDGERDRRAAEHQAHVGGDELKRIIANLTPPTLRLFQ